MGTLTVYPSLRCNGLKQVNARKTRTVAATAAQRQPAKTSKMYDNADERTRGSR